MESGDILTTIAEIAIAIAGFSSVIVALSPKPISQWSPIERFNFRILLQVAAVTVFFSLIPLVLHRTLSFDIAWRVALIFYGVVHLADVSSFLFRFPDHMPTVPKITSIIGLSIAMSQLVIGVANVTGLIELIYLIGLLWQLAISFMGFALLIYHVRTDQTEG